MTEFWWIVPLVIIVLCMFMMRGCMGGMMGRRDTRDETGKPRGHFSGSAGSAMEVLNKRYALGEIDKREYEEKKDAIIQTNG